MSLWKKPYAVFGLRRFIRRIAEDTENPFKSQEKTVILHKIPKTHRYAVQKIDSEKVPCHNG
jgi:hypothetical protein